MSKLKKIRLAFLLLLLIGTGFLREWIFVNINFQTQKVYYQNSDFSLPALLSFADSWSYSQLIYFKWFLTLVFIALYLLLNSFIIKLIFTDYRAKIRTTVFITLVVMVICGLLFLSSEWLHLYEKGYSMARFLLGLIQSPFLIMLLIPAFKLDKAESNT